MAENTYKEPEKNYIPGKPGRLLAFLRSLLNGSFLTLDRKPGLLLFLLFLTGLAILLIANTYTAEKKVRRIENLRSDVTELRTEYISNKAMLMYLSNQSEIANRLSGSGFVESTEPPRILKDQKQSRSFLLRIFQTR